MKDFLELIYSPDTKYCFIDYETFNLCLSFLHNRPWQIGILNTVGLLERSADDVLVNWTDECALSISKEAAVMTRYDHNKVLREGKMPREAFDLMRDRLEDADIIIGHNVLQFDMYLLKDYAEMYGVKWKHWMKKVIDTKAIAQGIKLNSLFSPHSGDSFQAYQWRLALDRTRGIKTRLSLLGKELGIEHDYEMLHDAVVDLRLNLKVWKELKHKFLLTA